MTEEFQRGVIPLARYQEQQLPEYQDNPLISALPPIPDLQEVVDLLQQLPGFEPQEALLDGRLRAHAIARLLHGFFQPLSHHLELESKISLMIRQGYIRSESGQRCLVCAPAEWLSPCRGGGSGCGGVPECLLYGQQPVAVRLLRLRQDAHAGADSGHVPPSSPSP